MHLHRQGYEALSLSLSHLKDQSSCCLSPWTHSSRWFVCSRLTVGFRLVGQKVQRQIKDSKTKIKTKSSVSGAPNTSAAVSPSGHVFLVDVFVRVEQHRWYLGDISVLRTISFCNGVFAKFCTLFFKNIVIKFYPDIEIVNDITRWVESIVTSLLSIIYLKTSSCRSTYTVFHQKWWPSPTEALPTWSQLQQGDQWDEHREHNEVLNLWVSITSVVDNFINKVHWRTVGQTLGCLQLRPMVQILEMWQKYLHIGMMSLMMFHTEEWKPWFDKT